MHLFYFLYEKYLFRFSSELLNIFQNGKHDCLYKWSHNCAIWFNTFRIYYFIIIQFNLSKTLISFKIGKIQYYKLHMDNDKLKGNPESKFKAGTKKGISRRGFLRGAGLTTVGTVALQTGVLGNAMPNETLAEKSIGPDASLIKLKVNGNFRTLAIEPRTTLAAALRDHLQLTGTKVVCDRGSCSACTVWVDGKPVNSCLTLAVEVAGKEITTIEGIGSVDKLHPVQEAFVAHDASQCGFCTPGMIMTATHLLENNATPNLEDVKVALRGNLCRCGTHPNVFKATLAAAKKM